MRQEWTRDQITSFLASLAECDPLISVSWVPFSSDIYLRTPCMVLYSGIVVFRKTPAGDALTFSFDIDIDDGELTITFSCVYVYSASDFGEVAHVPRRLWAAWEPAARRAVYASLREEVPLLIGELQSLLQKMEEADNAEAKER